jgi:hypothetical protein
MRLRAAVTGIKKAVPLANVHPAMKMSGIWDRSCSEGGRG